MSPLVGSRRGFDLLIRSRPQSSLSLGFSGAGGVRNLIWEKANPAWCWEQSCRGTFSLLRTLCIDGKEGRGKTAIGAENEDKNKQVRRIIKFCQLRQTILPNKEAGY